MGMSFIDLIDYIRLEGPYDQAHLPIANEEGAYTQGVSRLMRKKLLIRRRNPRRTPGGGVRTCRGKGT